MPADALRRSLAEERPPSSSAVETCRHHAALLTHSLPPRGEGSTLGEGDEGCRCSAPPWVAVDDEAPRYRRLSEEAAQGRRCCCFVAERKPRARRWKTPPRCSMSTPPGTSLLLGGCSCRYCSAPALLAKGKGGGWWWLPVVGAAIPSLLALSAIGRERDPRQ